ncbi:unnamed protein product, partial [Mesorhabditis belari]|uniref:G-protein coupled receptors family 1 profile domain-containing protein n=1 Tax=Mesorhabditis belari TaxID=2138241 RepID=A0AAF3FH88_9BILA
MDSSTTISNITEEDDEGFYTLSTYELIIWSILYSTIAILAVFGNLLVIFVTVGRLRTHSVTTYFIINLALADLLTGVFAIPFKFQAALFQVWHLPHILCKIVPYAESVTLSVSVFTLTASAVHEFRTVFAPRHGRLSTNSARLLVLLIWVLAAVLSLPMGLFHEVDTTMTPDGPIARCLPIYPEEQWWKVYNIYIIVVTYFIPMFILDTAYILIAIKIWTTTNTISEELQAVTDRSTADGNRKLMKMLIIVVAVFSLCWFPLETYLLLNEVKPEINGWFYIPVLFFCSHWLAMSNSCLNPIIYGLYNDKYNREYKRVFSKLRNWRWHTKGGTRSSSQNFTTEYPAITLIDKETSATNLNPPYVETFQVAAGIPTGKPTALW